MLLVKKPLNLDYFYALDILEKVVYNLGKFEWMFTALSQGTSTILWQI
ncbi:MAG: hypothetical protein KatS3mg096_775 [Candidatus Parcubacteria bacterium]|nr:MAG: hypothetical protein KatS3mg096_775 [Candidatus Parcubacteria bacterium]